MGDFYCNQVLNGKIDVQIIFETDLVLAFEHTQPYFEHHIVVVTKQHIDSLTMDEVINTQLALEFITALHRVASMLEKENGGCRISSNVGDYQSTKHLHWYVHSGERLRNQDGSEVKT